MSDAIQLIYPVGTNWVISQDFSEHVATAKKFGWCIRPGNNCSNGYYYPGIDWACSPGTRGRIAAAGVVIKAGLDPTTKANQDRGYGNRIQVRHDNGWQTIYAHLAEIFVGVGEEVMPDKIAFLTNNSGYSTGPHLHFELRDANGIPIDPSPYFMDSTPTLPGDVILTLPVFPKPIQFRLRNEWDWISIRSEPWGKIIGAIDHHDPFPAIGVSHEAADEVWLKIGYNQVVALLTPDKRHWLQVVEDA